MSIKETKRIVIAGSRNYNNYNEAKAYIDFCISNIRNEYNIIVISGGAKGADTLGERYANENGFTIERYLPDWRQHGKKAGPIRNREMAEVADYVICFWDGRSRGTKSMIEYSKQLNKPLKIKKV